MLIKCPECELPLSDKAIMCPHCGLPMTDTPKIPVKRSKRQHKRLPNGFGQISELKGRGLRKPFRAMITLGKTPEGRPICKILKPEGYFATYNEAYAALVKYNQNPYDLDKEITMEQLYEEWSKKYFEKIQKSTERGIVWAWKYCNNIYSMPVRYVRTRHVKGCIDNGFIIVNGEKKYTNNLIKKKIKSVLNLLLDYAVEYELTDRNYARAFALSNDINKDIEKDRKSHISFAPSEMKALWNNKTKDGVDIILVQCYTGLRPQEICNIKLSDVNLEENEIVGGMKTTAGINRIIPIHSAIKQLIVDRYKEAFSLGSDYLFNIKGKGEFRNIPLNYEPYRQLFTNIITDLELNPLHRPHDARKQFITMAKKYNMDEYALKRIVGHIINDITESVYTDRDKNWLHEEIEKIRVEDLQTI